MGSLNFPVISIGDKRGNRIQGVSVDPDRVAIPTMANGDLPKFLYVVITAGGAGEYVTVSPTLDADGSIDTGIPLNTEGGGIILNVHGFTHIGTEASDVNQNISLYPLEDF
jgi:hypothetical protein